MYQVDPGTFYSNVLPEHLIPVITLEKSDAHYD